MTAFELNQLRDLAQSATPNVVPATIDQVLAIRRRISGLITIADSQGARLELHAYGESARSDAVATLASEVDRLTLLSRESTAWHEISRREVVALRRQRDLLLDMLLRSGVRYDEIARAIDRDARDAMAEIGAKEDGK